MTKDPIELAKVIGDYATRDRNSDIAPYRVRNPNSSWEVVKILDDSGKFNFVCQCVNEVDSNKIVDLLNRQWREERNLHITPSEGILIGKMAQAYLNSDRQDADVYGKIRAAMGDVFDVVRPYLNTTGSSNGDTMQELYALSEANCKSAPSKAEPHIEVGYALLAGVAMGALYQVLLALKKPDYELSQVIEIADKARINLNEMHEKMLRMELEASKV